MADKKHAKIHRTHLAISWPWFRISLFHDGVSTLTVFKKVSCFCFNTFHKKSKTSISPDSVHIFYTKFFPPLCLKVVVYWKTSISDACPQENSEKRSKHNWFASEGGAQKPAKAGVWPEWERGTFQKVNTSFELLYIISSLRWIQV